MPTMKEVWEQREEVAAEREFVARHRRACEISDMTPEEIDRREDEILDRDKPDSVVDCPHPQCDCVDCWDNGTIDF